MRCLLILACSNLLLAQQAPDLDPAREFFAKPAVVHVQFTLDPAQQQHLRDKPREYATATLRIDDQQFDNVGIKLKGAAGSFRNFDERPGFTVNLGKFGGKERFHGLNRFHLNNGVQDDTRLCEWLGHEIFAAAGLPAPRVSHARVHVGDRDLGVYVLREAFDHQFLLRNFGTVAGNLYDGGFCQDVDQDLEKDSGDGVGDHGDLHRLCEQCRGVDDHRAAALGEVIDLKHFVDFAALEAMLCHWDGYCLNRNNFRLWLPTTGGAVFLPHGMDQLLGDPEASVLDHPPAIVASAVMQQPTLRKLYRERVRALLPLFTPAKLRPRFDAEVKVLQREFATVDEATARAHAEAARGLFDRFSDRCRDLAKQARAPEPKAAVLAIGKSMALKVWRPAAETDGLEIEKKDFHDVTTLLVHVLDGADAKRHGGFRAHALLTHGRYQLRATARCEKLSSTAPDGAALRVDDHQSESLNGDHNWQALTCDFEVAEFQRNVELSLDVQALGGRAWFRFDSLQLVRLPD